MICLSKGQFTFKPNTWAILFLISTQKLTNMRIMKENMRTGNLPANMKKNRVLQIIPCKGFRNCFFC